MQPTESREARFDYEDEIDLLELWAALWKGKWVVIIVTAVFAVGSVFYSLSLPNIYRTQVLLSPVEEGNVNSNASLLGQFGGLADLAGMSIGGTTSASQKVRALAILQSRAFIKDFFLNHNLTVPFMASRPVGRTGDVEIDPELYDTENQVWVREVVPPRQPMPSDWEIYEDFSGVLAVEDDIETGLVTVSLEWYDPEQIQDWLTWLVQDLNEVMKAREVAEASRAIEYLNEQLQKTQLVNMQNVFYNLIEQQTRTVMLADSREEYAFETLDPAVVPEEKSAPSRAFICIIATLLGGMLATLIVLLPIVFGARK